MKTKKHYISFKLILRNFDSYCCFKNLYKIIKLDLDLQVLKSIVSYGNWWSNRLF